MRALLWKISLLISLSLCALAGAYIASIGARTRAIERDFNALQDGIFAASVWPELAARADSLAAFAPWDFDPHDLRGRVYFYGAAVLSVDLPRQSIQRFRQAQGSFERAAQLRPTWAYTQLNLARVQFALDVNGPWQNHLWQMLASGPRDLFLQMDLMRFRKDLGQRLQGDLAKAVEASQQLTAQAHPYLMVRLAAKLNRLEWVCANQVPIGRQVCRQMAQP
jgi:hypothetical protein